MNKFVIDKSIIGSSKNLLFDGETYSWIDFVPNDLWYIDQRFHENNSMCFNTLLKLENHNINLLPEEKFITAMKSIIDDAHWPPPWKRIIPPDVHKKFIERIVNEISSSLLTVNKDYYIGTWMKVNDLFKDIHRAKINKLKLNEFLKLETGNIPALKSFIPDEDGFSKKIVYNRFGTRTGRLTVESGPQILTLKKDHRKILESRWGAKGKIVYLDYTALEPRIVLYEAGLHCDDNDLYQSINNKIFNGEFNRDAIKNAIISTIYGQSKSSLKKSLNIEEDKLDDFIEKINSYFKVDEFLNRIKSQYIKNGFILNRYGRKVNIENPSNHMLINTYVQSTGADIALLGFKKIVEKIQNLQAKFIFLLVDAIVIDCHIDDLEKIREISNITVDGYDQTWPLKLDYV